MNVHFNLFNIILLLGTLQGLILSLMLLLPGTDKRQSKYFLAAFMLVLAYNSFGTFYWSVGLSIRWLEFFDSIFPFTFIFSLGPSFYLYIKTTIETDRIPSKTIFKTYLPAIIDFAFRILLVVCAILNNNGISPGVNARSIDTIYQPVAQGLVVIVFWTYLIAAILRFRKRGQDRLITIDVSSISITEQKLAGKWIKVLLITMTFVALVWAITIFDALIFNITRIGFFEPIEVILVVFVYWIGLRGYQLTRVVYISDQKAAKTYAESIGTEEAEKCIRLLKDAMETDKLYLDPELNVNKLADHLVISPKFISAVLNRQLKKGFSAFVNEYRLVEVKEKMLHPDNSHITLAGIALNSGFNSVATFQRVFKASENMSPKEFLSRNKETLVK